MQKHLLRPPPPIHIHPLNAKCMHLGLPFQGANIVHAGASEWSCGHELLCRQPVSIISHIQGEVNVIHKLDCMSLAYCGFLWIILAVKTNVEINQQHALRQLTLATHMHLTACTSSHLALRLGWKKQQQQTKNTLLYVPYSRKFWCSVWGQTAKECQYFRLCSKLAPSSQHAFIMQLQWGYPKPPCIHFYLNA